jgi:hypothetical protein
MLLESVIPQNVLFAAFRGKMHIYAESDFLSFVSKTNRIPDKIVFPCPRAGKSDFSGMTRIVEGS